MHFDSDKVTGVPITRRTLLRTATGLISATIVAPTGLALADVEAPRGNQASPGVAGQLIDGRAKVTGAKIYARDFSARNMKGWPKDQWFALYLCAQTTQRAFLGLDLSGLPSQAKPAKVVLGDQLGQSHRAPIVLHTQDLMVEDEEFATKQTAIAGDRGGFDNPEALGTDLLVRPGSVPMYLGQGVALLLFSSLASYRAAKDALQFRDAEFQIYGVDDNAGPAASKIYDPSTTYVKYVRDGYDFSFAARDAVTYARDFPAYRTKIADFLKAHEAEFFRQDLTLETQSMDPMFMEPETGLVWYNAATQTLELVLGTQSPDSDIAAITVMYGAVDSPVKIKEIRLTSCPPGGAFGGRDASPYSLLLALVAPFSDGHPVRLMHDRFEQFRLGLKRPGAKMRGAVTVASDMTLQSIEMTMSFNGGGLKNLSPYVANLAALCVGGAYEFPLANIYAQSARSRDIPGGSQRGFGGPEAFFAVETALDDIAAAKNWDPISLRRANLATPKTLTVVGGPIAQELRLAEMLDRVEDHPLWTERAKIKNDYAAKRIAYGTGLAMSLQAYGTSADAAVAAVTMGSDGALSVRSDAVDFGNGSATTLAVVIGPILGANAKTIAMGDYTLFGQTGLDNSRGPPKWQDPHWTQKAVGSSSACLTGLHQVHVVQQVALAYMHFAILPAARRLWNRAEIAFEDIAWVDGRLTAKAGGFEPLTHARLAQAIYLWGLPSGALGHAFFQASWVEADYAVGGNSVRLKLDGLSLYSTDATKPTQILRSNTQAPPPSAARYSRYLWAPCVNVVSLVVDRTTGRVRVDNVLSVLNAGRVHVPELVSGQSQGGVAMAIGYTLLEDMPDGMSGPASGTWNLDRYHVPRLFDVPHRSQYASGGRAQELIVMPESPGDGRAGRGIAEAVMCSVAPAISNALRDALGVRYASLPITPTKILAGLHP
jgi:CO/xanthine dehydrogenase Mo-binding subunit